MTSVVGDSTYAGKEFRCTQNRRKRGFTLVEMMVSMALVLLVTAAVVASVQVSYRTIRQNHIERCAIREAENLALCFESKDYDSGVKLLYGDKIHATTENTVEVFFTQDGNAVLNTDHSAVWKLSATVMNDRLLVYAYRTADNELIYKIQVLR